MTKLCPRGKAAAKRKSASGSKRKDFKGPKPAGKAMGGRIYKAGGGVAEAAEKLRRQGLKNGGIARGCGRVMSNRRKVTKVY